MPENVVQYNMLISCPGDIQDEVNIIEKVVEEFNERFTDELAFRYKQNNGKGVHILNREGNHRIC